jgi:hypothetical protein
MKRIGKQSIGNYEKRSEETSYRIPYSDQPLANSLNDCWLYRGQVHIILKLVKGGIAPNNPKGELNGRQNQSKCRPCH